MDEIKDCAFQYATGRGDIIENTDLITLSEAKDLWNKYIPDFKKKLESDESPEMGIWINMDNNWNYRESMIHADSDTQIDSAGNLYNITKNYLEV